jgi:hypothetical protein
MKMTLRFTLAILLAAGLLAAKKDRMWLTGKVMASRTVEVGATAGPGSYVGGFHPPPAVVARTITAAELEIFGGDYAYTIRDLGSGAIVRRPCRYIVGDPIKYAQEKSVLYLLDADGTECRAQVMTQERLPADLKQAAPPPAPPAKP